MERSQIALAILLFAAGAAAHGGHLHEFPKTPSGSNYIRTKVATCSKWVPADATVVYSLVDSTTPAAAATSKPVVKGDVTVWQYLYKNCSLTDDAPLPSAGVEFNVTLSSSSATKPVANISLDGVAMTGSCASGGGSPFYFDPKAEPVDDAENLLWFHNFTLPKSGLVHGNGANDGPVLTSPAGRGIKSVMLVNAKTGAALSCCDLVLAGPATTDWAATLAGKGTNCTDEPSEASTVGVSTHNSHAAPANASADTPAASSTAAAAPAKSGAAGVSAAVSTAAVAAFAALVAALL